MFNSLLENINRRNRSYDLIGQQPVRPQIQRISPVNITPEVQNVPMPISPGLSAVTAQSLAPPTAQVPDPVAQELPLPQSQGLTPPVAQELPLPQSQGLTPPVAQEMGPPQPMELDLPKEITSTDLAQGAVAAIKQGGIQGGDEGAAQGFGQWMQKVASDDEAMGSIILALNSLRTKPDANLATAMREQISASRKQRKETATKNRTLEVLKGLPGVTDEIMKIAEVDPLAAIKMATEKKKVSTFAEKVALYDEDPKKFKAMMGAQRGGTTVNVDTGTIPADMRAVRDENGKIIQYEVIPGSKTDLARKAAEVATTGREKTKSTAAETVVSSIKGLRKALEDETWSSPVTGVTGEVLGAAGPLKAGSLRANAEGYVQTIRSNVGFDRLQRMRDESPTGGALGNVSDLEVKTLQATIGDLNLNQSPDKIEEVLANIEKQYNVIMNKAAAYPNAQQHGFTAPSTQSNDDPLGIL